MTDTRGREKREKKRKFEGNSLISREIFGGGEQERAVNGREEERNYLKHSIYVLIPDLPDTECDFMTYSHCTGQESSSMYFLLHSRDNLGEFVYHELHELCPLNKPGASGLISITNHE